MPYSGLLQKHFQVFSSVKSMFRVCLKILRPAWNYSNLLSINFRILKPFKYPKIRYPYRVYSCFKYLMPKLYDSVWLKVIAILSYFIDLLACAVMLAFINYENGHHGNFRSVINQLLSTLYAMVSLHFLTFHKYSHNFCFVNILLITCQQPYITDMNKKSCQITF